jgi:hypothetical protein
MARLNKPFFLIFYAPITARQCVCTRLAYCATFSGCTTEVKAGVGKLTGFYSSSIRSNENNLAS